MTEPVREFKLPDPCFPAVNRVQADPPFPTDGDPRPLRDQEPITWTTGAAHPLIGETSKVVRMYLMPECQGVEIYCLTDKKTPDGRDANIATRHTIPWSRIRDVEELMDPERSSRQSPTPKATATVPTGPQRRTAPRRAKILPMLPTHAPWFIGRLYDGRRRHAAHGPRGRGALLERRRRSGALGLYDCTVASDDGTVGANAMRTIVLTSARGFSRSSRRRPRGSGPSPTSTRTPSTGRAMPSSRRPLPSSRRRPRGIPTMSKKPPAGDYAPVDARRADPRELGV